MLWSKNSLQKLVADICFQSTCEVCERTIPMETANIQRTLLLPTWPEAHCLFQAKNFGETPGNASLCYEGQYNPYMLGVGRGVNVRENELNRWSQIEILYEVWSAKRFLTNKLCTSLVSIFNPSASVLCLISLINLINMSATNEVTFVFILYLVNLDLG